jgi:hypothetical protein
MRTGVAVCLALAASGAAHAKDLPESVSLMGRWQILPEHPKEDVAAAPAKFVGWMDFDVPAMWGRALANPRVPCVWFMKRFSLGPYDANLDWELFFERVQWRSEVWLNGRKLGGPENGVRPQPKDIKGSDPILPPGGSTDGYAPFRLMATGAVKPGAENVLVVRVSGRDEVPRAKCGNLLTPAGFAEGGGGPGGILGDVRLHPFRQVRVTRAQVAPDLAGKAAHVLLRLEGAGEAADVEVTVAEAVSGRTVGSAKATVSLANGAGETTVRVPLAEVRPWTPAAPFLYRFTVCAMQGGEPADSCSRRFGMREITWKSDGYYLNGRKFRFFGANIMGESPWWRGAVLDPAYVRSSIVTPARRINANCIRTHGGPLPDWWLDVCDEEGLLVLLEFPVTVNCARIDFDAAELAEYQRNLTTMATGLVPHLAHHPSVAMWVTTNESTNWDEWERGPLYRHFKALDPTRPVIRAAMETPDTYDVHSYSGVWKGSAGDFEVGLRAKASKAGANGVPLFLSEYLDLGLGRNGFGDIRVTRKWMGPAIDTADEPVLERIRAQCREFFADRASEQTEAARRIGYHGIMPFGPGFWLQPDGTPSWTGLAVRSALAPVGVSIDLFNRHFAAGSLCTADVWVMNDTDRDVSVAVSCDLSAEDPGFDPEAVRPKALGGERLKVDVPAHAVHKQRVTWQTPEKEGKYYLAARLESAGAAPSPAMSRRPLYAIERRPPPAPPAGRKLIVFENDATFSTWARGLGCRVVEPPTTRPEPPAPPLGDVDLVVVAPQAANSAAFKALAPALPAYVNDGGRLLILEQLEWPTFRLMDPLKGIALERTDYDTSANMTACCGGTSRVFRWEEPQRALWQGLPDDYLWRWNGQEGRVARVSLSTLPGRARILVRYAEAERDDLKFVPVAAIPHGRGEVLLMMLQVNRRYRLEDPDFDPVVERLMVNLLQQRWRP